MIRTEEEVDTIVKEMKERTKGNYITQGVSFNKSCPRQIRLLKSALLNSTSFSGLIKEMLAINLNNSNSLVSNKIEVNNDTGNKSKSVGNFI